MNFVLSIRICLLISLPALFLCGATQNSVAQTEKQTWPGSLFETSEFDFGNVLADTVAKKQFTISNDEDETLELEASVSTGNFSVELSTDSIGPGETAELTCKFAPLSNRRGIRKSVVTVSVAGKKKAVHKIEVKGKSSLIVFEPEEIDFGDVTIGEEATATVKVSIANSSGLGLADVECKYKHVRVKAGKPTDVNEAKVYNMNFRLLPTASAGKVKNKLSFIFRVNGKPRADKTRKRLPFVGRVKKADEEKDEAEETEDEKDKSE